MLFAECADRLGMENGDIKDSQITASSYREPGELPKYGRLNNKKYWCAKEKSKNEYLQVDLGRVRKNIQWNPLLSVSPFKNTAMSFFQSLTE